MLGFGQTFNGMLEKELLNTVISFSLPTDPTNTVYFTLINNDKYLTSYSNGDKTITHSNNNHIWWIDVSDYLNIFYNSIEYKIPSYSNGYGRWYNYNTNNASTGVLKGVQISNPLPRINFSIKNYVEEKINSWQKKDEFEKLAQYQIRVTKNTRNQQINLYQQEAIYLLKKEAIDSFDTSEIELQKYDSENETFLLKLSDTESFLLPVPINVARNFSDSYNPKLFSNLDMVIKDDAFILSHIEYNNLYSYDITDDNSYAVTTFDYNFDEIDIDIKQSNFSNITTTKNKTIRVGNSFVDSNIPKNKKVNNRYALVIGNEDYSSYQRTLNSEQNVDYAENDATIFKQYCLNTLGVKQDNMHFLLNATAGQMSQEIDLVSKIVSKLGPDAELIVYYAGHGYPDELTKVPYLIPVDVSASNLSSALKLSDLYSKLSDTKASKVTIFLDACFTGGGRNSGLVASRGVKVRPKEGSLSGNLIVFSASSGDQSSLPYHKEAHGMFTYHVLKKLQKSEGNVSMGELSDYLVDSVSIRSLKENEKEQDPNVNISQEVIDDWINWKF